jgi:hypothetical protein
VPDIRVGSCLNPELLGTSLERRARQGEGEAEAGPVPPSVSGGRLLESSRYGGNMIEACEKPIRDMMQQGQRPTK